jgi:formate-dependent nitrite reductase membrane component NrfD
MMPLAEHFARAPEWGVWILLYFFFAGIAGGAYVIATIVRLRGGVASPVARTGYLIALPCVLLCPVFLTIDLGQPLRFWHMMLDTTPGELGLNFNTATPMSLGVWGLLVFGFFSLVSFLAELEAGWARPARILLRGPLGTAFAAVGSLFGLFVAGYTGVLLSVSNQPVWSDTPVLGGLFLASGMSGAAAAIGLLLGRRGRSAPGDVEGLDQADSYFAALELLLLVIFFVTVAIAGTLGTALRMPWTLLWLIAILSLAFPLAGLVGRDVRVQPGSGVAAGARALRTSGAMTAVGVLVGVLALRAAVIFSAQ